MNYETNRLNTFTNWPSSAPVDPIRIAKAGFYYTGQGTEVQCFSCDGKISEWNYGDQVMWRHRRLKPNCSFVINPSLSGNVPLVLGRECPSVVDSTTSLSVPDNSQQNTTETLQENETTEEDEMHRNDALRLLSYIHWEDRSVSREALVNAGFYHTGEGRLRCAWCGGELSPFRRFGDIGPPLEVHRMYFPRCRYAAAVDVAQRRSNRSPQYSPPSFTPPTRSSPNVMESQLQSSGAAHNERVLEGATVGASTGGGTASTWRSLGVVSGGARHPEYAAMAARLSTYQRWPADRAQNPQTLSEAGFFYTGVDDQVRCFYCDGGLGKWEASDSPWSEHARWFPHCGYVLLVKGQDYIDSCRERTTQQRTNNTDSAPSTRQGNSRVDSPTTETQHNTDNVSSTRQGNSRVDFPTTEFQRNTDTTVSSTRQGNSRVNHPITETQVSEAMESDVALAALSTGLDVARVRRAIVRRLRHTGLPFSSSEALIDATLNEQLGEESWSVSPPSQRLARDILAEALRDFAPASGIIPMSQDEYRPESQRSDSENSVRSSSPVNTTQITRLLEELNIRECNEYSNQCNTVENNEDNQSNVDFTPEGKQLSLEEENRQLKEARLCKVCMDSEVSVVFLPCGHLVSCARCGAALSACPLCRAAVRALVRAYLA